MYIFFFFFFQNPLPNNSLQKIICLSLHFLYVMEQYRGNTKKKSTLPIQYGDCLKNNQVEKKILLLMSLFSLVQTVAQLNSSKLMKTLGNIIWKNI